MADTNRREEMAIATLTLLVAVCDQALVELNDVEPRPTSLLEQVRLTHAAAVEAVSRIARAA
jgi:hypothetical protein